MVKEKSFCKNELFWITKLPGNTETLQQPFFFAKRVSPAILGTLFAMGVGGIFSTTRKCCICGFNGNSCGACLLFSGGCVPQCNGWI